MRSKLINICLVLAVVIILLVFGLYVRIGATADAVVVMKTSGMGCASCTARVSKALQSEKGVAATEVDLQRGVVVAGYDSKQVSAEKLVRTVTEAGFASNVQSVITPEQFRKVSGHNVGRLAGGDGCCGRGCCAK
ncbi:heavy-metal-associated domain-containing protein [Geomonas sp.]|uniref:heavy-metal-associated domain-containing protein n=1 Tax=Geomonas sp. TaxID=2651584 RepID=UPI002B4A6A1F|nr:heavy-metal-associated domain-containing protein [Geomonas sp.]HJV37124.1 heavy-metal-associated domain-containing protein [Geomonas sp.]